MSVEQKLSYPFLVEPFQEDASGALSWSVLGNLLLRVSSLHAESHGFGYSYMKQQQRGWVLSRLVVEMERMPQTAEAYAVETWVNRIYRQFTDRLYRLSTPEGVALGHGFSTWALIDYDNRVPVSLETLPEGGFSAALWDEGVPITAPERVRFKAPVLCYEHRSGYADLDINGHVNSIRYIELLLNSLEASAFQLRALRRVDLAYLLEGRAGDVLRVYREALSEEKWIFEVRRLQPESEAVEQTLLRAVLTFGERV